jgi:hypothetical protein
MKEEELFMESIIVLSLRKNAPPPPEGFSLVRVDRRNPILGNPHEMANQSLAERKRVISEFRKDVDFSRRNGGKLWREIEKLADRVQKGEKLGLQCWCSPKACHADVIKSAIQYILKQRRHPVTGQQTLSL